MRLRRLPVRLLSVTLVFASACAHVGNAARPISATVSAASDAPFASRALASAANELSPDELRSLIEARKGRIAEFAFLREWAAKRGLRVWAAGGSAAGFAYYVKQHAEHERLLARGEPSPYFGTRFKYGYYQVFRSTQDADIILDATEAEAVELEQALRERFDYLQGSKSAWEVRLLRHPRGEGAGLKEPLIDNPNFLDQNSDSHSTGMIELTDPPRGESAVRDLFDWGNQKDPVFLRDVAEGKLHFYRNPRHFGTSRAKQGLNPEILSVIRALTKSFQYGPEIRAEDLAEMKAIVAEFDPADPALASARNQIEGNAKKLYSHAEDLERAYRTLERLGLREKLLRLGDAGGDAPSAMAQLLNRVPLLSEALGTTGRTAGEIFGTKEPIVVAHETRDLLVYESITRSRRGLPNALASRQGAEGSVSKEAAVHGDGFYTKLGRRGARGTGITIRFTLDPNAREGKDFVYVEDHDYVVVRNRRVLRVIDETVRMEPLDFFRFAAEVRLDAADRGLWRMLGLMMRPGLADLPETARREIGKLALAAIRRTGMLPEWTSEHLLPIASLRRAFEETLRAASPADQGAVAHAFWRFRMERTPGWSAFLHETGILEGYRSEVAGLLDAVLLADRGAEKSPLFPETVKIGSEEVIVEALARAEAIDGRARLVERLAELDLERKRRLLGRVAQIHPNQRLKRDGKMALLREAGILAEAREWLSEALTKALAGELGESGNLPPLFLKAWARRREIVNDWMELARDVYGVAELRARIESWDFATKEGVLLSLNSESRFLEFVGESVMRDPRRPPDLGRRWEAGELRPHLLPYRFRLGPITGSPYAYLPRLRTPGVDSGIIQALDRAERLGDREALAVAVQFARAFSEPTVALTTQRLKKYCEEFVARHAEVAGKTPDCPDLLGPAR